jgi:hypothetical protein
MINKREDNLSMKRIFDIQYYTGCIDLTMPVN